MLARAVSAAAPTAISAAAASAAVATARRSAAKATTGTATSTTGPGSTRAATAPRTLSPGAAAGDNGLGRQQTFALHLLASQLAGAANGFCLFPGPLLGGLFEVVPELHLPENALALELFLESFESLVDVVVAYENLQETEPLLLSG